MSYKIMAINAGSSSLKFQLLNMPQGALICQGLIERIGLPEARFTLKTPAQKWQETLPIADHHEAVTLLLEALTGRGILSSLQEIDGVGHRVAHGGDLFTESVIISEEVINNIRQVSSLAPLHNYASLSGIASAQRLFPEVMQVAVFDTSFHQTLAPEAFLYGLPWEYYQNLGVRRYGFHGTSHRYVSQRALALLGLPEQESGLVIAHLGNGASICAVRNGRSVDTSMGMTPLEGLMMGTRSGDVDFGAMAWIAGETRQTLSDLERVANTASGLLGISGLSSDLRVLEQAWHEGHARARLAIKTFVHRIARHIAGHAAALQRLDGIIFTGGIGENSVLIRRLVSERLAVFGLEMDVARNQQPNSAGERLISADGSRVRCAVIPTNEERMIALDAIRLGRIHTAAALA